MVEETRLIIEFVGAVLIAFITHYLTKSHYERKRQDDLADRQFNRRATVYDMRINEARLLLDNWDSTIHFYGTFIFGIAFTLLEGDTSEIARRKQVENSSTQMALLLKENTVSKSSLFVLNDKELLDLQDEYKSVFLDIVLNQIEILERFVKKDASDTELLDDVKTFSKDVNKASNLITKMKIRLDELVQTVS
jgi:hypothetical protein